MWWMKMVLDRRQQKINITRPPPLILFSVFSCAVHLENGMIINVLNFIDEKRERVCARERERESVCVKECREQQF
jgi:hypothetical protein